jgi:hypothetical protein
MDGDPATRGSQLEPIPAARGRPIRTPFVWLAAVASCFCVAAAVLALATYALAGREFWRALLMLPSFVLVAAWALRLLWSRRDGRDGRRDTLPFGPPIAIGLAMVAFAVVPLLQPHPSTLDGLFSACLAVGGLQTLWRARIGHAAAGRTPAP